MEYQIYLLYSYFLEQGMRIGADYQAVVPEDYEPPGKKYLLL